DGGLPLRGAMRRALASSLFLPLAAYPGGATPQKPRHYTKVLLGTQANNRRRTCQGNREVAERRRLSAERSTGTLCLDPGSGPRPRLKMPRRTTAADDHAAFITPGVFF